MDEETKGKVRKWAEEVEARDKEFRKKTGEYVSFFRDYVTLDGDFTSNQLREIASMQEHLNKEHPSNA